VKNKVLPVVETTIPAKSRSSRRSCWAIVSATPSNSINTKELNEEAIFTTSANHCCFVGRGGAGACTEQLSQAHQECYKGILNRVLNKNTSSVLFFTFRVKNSMHKWKFLKVSNGKRGILNSGSLDDVNSDVWLSVSR
jgi:hypothetical protein